MGGSEREFVSVAVRAYERAATGDRYDDNWLAVEVTVAAGAFRGQFPATFLTDELVRFRAELGTLNVSLAGWARFRTLEEQLALSVFGNGRGEIELSGTVIDRAGDGNRLEFRLGLDQTYLAEALRGLDDIISTYPVRA
jgi:hypothetical protein